MVKEQTEQQPPLAEANQNLAASATLLDALLPPKVYQRLKSILSTVAMQQA
jgi:hypothetical protein